MPSTSWWPVIAQFVVVLVVFAAATVVAVLVVRRHSAPLLAKVAAIAVAAAAIVPLLILSSEAHMPSPDGTDGTVTCPMTTAENTVMAGSGELYEFWKPCVTNARLRAALAIGGYALVAGAVGLIALRSGRESSLAPGRESATVV